MGIDAEHGPVVSLMAGVCGRGRVARRRAVVWLWVVLAVALPAHAWGPEGHRLIGLVAEEALDARTRDEVRALVGDQSLADVGLWLDQQRGRMMHEHPGSERWHYDNEPVCRSDAGRARYCADGNCASGAYERALARLRDRTAPRSERLEALRIVVHVVGDIHQPLHAADNGDRGGNQQSVRVGRHSRPKSLHAAWDGDFVKRALNGGSEQGFARALVSARRPKLRELEAGSFASWEAESHKIAGDYAYGRLPGFACRASTEAIIPLPVAYSDGAAQIVSDRMALAGIRLAAVLRSAL